MANSNLVLNVGIQTQDSIAPQGVNPLTALARTLTFPVPTQQVYSGYTIVTSTTFVLFNAGTNIKVPFMFLRNANTSGSARLNAAIIFATGVSTVSVELTPQAIFLYANPSIDSQQDNALTQMQFASIDGTPIIVEYLYAY